MPRNQSHCLQAVKVISYEEITVHIAKEGDTEGLQLLVQMNKSLTSVNIPEEPKGNFLPGRTAEVCGIRQYI